MVKALILLSPVGLSSNYAYIESTQIEDFLQILSFHTKYPPSELFKSFGFISSFIFDYIFLRKMKNISNQVFIFTFLPKIKKEIDTIKEFMKSLFYKKSSTCENAIFTFFNKNLQAYQPVTDFSEYFKYKKILIIYGEEDWSPISHAFDVNNLNY